MTDLYLAQTLAFSIQKFNAEKVDPPLTFDADYPYHEGIVRALAQELYHRYKGNL